jgi:O-acetylserine/cysteine efflux transporter
MSTARLPLSYALLALAIVAVWGTNFVVIRYGLNHLPPLLFAALRFAFAVVPAIFFLPRPAVRWLSLAAYGLLIGVGQFGLLYMAMHGQISPGLASLIVQTQVFFTIGLAVVLTGERPGWAQLCALAIAVCGVLLIALHVDPAATPLGIAMVLAAGLSWAGGNIVAKVARPGNILAFVVWASLFSAIPLFGLSLAVEGWPAIVRGLRAADLGTWAAVLWQAYGNVLFGFGAWGWLLARRPASTIAPTALLVPVFGMGASALLLGEPMPFWKLAAAALVIGGLAIGVLWPARSR